MKRTIIIAAMLTISFFLTGCGNVESGGDITIESTILSDANNLPYWKDVAQKAGAKDRGVSATLNGQTQTSLDSELFDSLYDDVWTIPHTYTTTGIDILTEDDNLMALLMAAGGGIALRTSGADDRIADDFERKPAFRDKWSDEGLAIVGGPGFHFAAAGLWYAIAHNSDDEFNKGRAWKMIEALSITGATTLGLKLAVNDDCPNGKPLAWPSGHTSSSFTVAAVLDEFYGPQVGFPAYIGAGLVAYRMMDTGDHWASDVVFGMVLGHIVGHQVAGDGKMELAGFEVLPYLNSDQQTSFGLSFAKTF